MLGMVPGMFDRLSLCQSADGEEAEYQEDREIFEGAVFHRIMTIIISPQCYWRLARPVKTAISMVAACRVYLVYSVCLVCPVYVVGSPKHTRQTE